MSTSRLPEHEQRILDEIERALSRDRRLARRLRPPRRHRPDLSKVAQWAPRPWTAVLLVLVSAALLAAGIVTDDPGVIWAFAVLWAPASFAVLRLLCRWSSARGG
ncbi:DUF3040 domain-containing protein [Streptomyces thermodiastaticus]|uniref:DUF3040 domain-containing protein n=1 Tax=Streptomyces thermodiastaticus TaxID=44061 RepID=UPI0016791A01|nr:DUF3040 domain-containing protein [Streptomyces thermodiastaticus]MCE7549130.1 DUF3040 domain-containing protein [Streptomyces thermodiastaticus]GHF60377.1 hypothetical protein GCM10018787_05650 [Streptomyces thermodiastaticus]